MRKFHMVAYTLVLVGALNWGLVGAFDYNLVSMIFGSWPMLETWVYILVGLSAVSEILCHKEICRECGKK